MLNKTCYSKCNFFITRRCCFSCHRYHILHKTSYSKVLFCHLKKKAFEFLDLKRNFAFLESLKLHDKRGNCKMERTNMKKCAQKRRKKCSCVRNDLAIDVVCQYVSQRQEKETPVKIDKVYSLSQSRIHQTLS